MGGCVLVRYDTQWNLYDKTYYIHNLVSIPTLHGAGKTILEACIEKAKSDGVDFVRLDCVKDNQTLTDYYRAFGFHFDSVFTSLYYVGNKLEYTLHNR